jgi:hypothetical protein
MLRNIQKSEDLATQFSLSLSPETSSLEYVIQITT